MSDDWRDRVTARVCPARGCGYVLELNDDGEPECWAHGVQPESEYLHENNPSEGEQVELGDVMAADGGDAA